MKRDLYEILGVPHDANLVEIRKAYRSKAVWMHPDKGGDPEEFSVLQDSYAVLSNASRRAHYDETGRTELTAQEELKSGMVKTEAGSPAYRGSPAKAEVPADAQLQGVSRPAVSAFCKLTAAQNPPRGQAGRSPSPVRPPARQSRKPKAAAPVEYADPIQVPEEYIKPVVHVAVAGITNKSLHLTDMYPKIKDGKLQAGEVLLRMRALPLSYRDLITEGRYDPGDIFGWQGIAQVLFVGPQANGLQVGDWVVPLLEADEDGDVVEDAAPPQTGRTLAVFLASRCLRVSRSSGTVLTVGQLALAKSIGAAKCMIEQYASNATNDSVIVNAANGVVGQMLVQMLVILKYRVFAVIKAHEDPLEDMRGLLEGYGAYKVLFDDDSLKQQIEAMHVELPELAFDGVGGEGTANIASALSRTGSIVCYQSGKQVWPQGWLKKFKGGTYEFSFDEWVQEDMQANTDKFNNMLDSVQQLLRAGRLKLHVKEYTTDQFDEAVEVSACHGRCSAVVLHLPSLDDQVEPSQINKPMHTSSHQEAKNISQTKANMQTERERRTNFSWDLAFLEWEKDEAEETERRQEMETNLFQPDPIMEEMRIQRYVDDSLATPVALELGAARGEAKFILFWLPGSNDVPEEHAPWLSRLCQETPGLRAVVLKPRVGTKWFDMSDYDCVKLGLRFAVEDDDYLENNMEGDFLKSKGNITFGLLETAEAEAVQQVETAALGLARRAIIEEKALGERRAGCLPFFFGGFGQGGSVALYTAICLMQAPILGVAFCHSGIPCGAMLGKRLTQRTKNFTKMYAIYDKADNQVPPVFAEAFIHMLDLMDCSVSLHWLHAGDGHEFFDDAAAKVTACLKKCLAEEAKAPKAESRAPVTRSDYFHPALPTGYLQPQRMVNVKQVTRLPQPGPF